MEFGMEKCAMLVMKSAKRHLTDGMKLPNQDKIRTLGEKETYKYLGILEADTIRQVEMKEKNKKEYLRHYIQDYICQERKKEEYLLALKTMLTHQYNDLKTTFQKRGGRLITSTRINTDNTRTKRTKITRKQKWEEKQLYGRFKRLISNISHEKTWTWIKKGKP